MAYDLTTAKAQLANLIKGSYIKGDLFELAKQVDVTASGNVTVLYSNMDYAIMEEMKTDPNVSIHSP